MDNLPDGVLCIICKTLISKRVKWRPVTHAIGSSGAHDLIFFAAAHERCADGEEAWQAEHPLRLPPTRKHRKAKAND